MEKLFVLCFNNIFYKIAHVIIEKCIANFNPQRDQSIYEAMVAFKGRLSSRQYLPAKPTKFGVKVWILPRISSVYRTEAGLGSRVVSDLSEKISNKYYHIYVDNYYSSLALFEQLYQHGIYACGSVRSHR